MYMYIYIFNEKNKLYPKLKIYNVITIHIVPVPIYYKQ